MMHFISSNIFQLLYRFLITSPIKYHRVFSQETKLYHVSRTYSFKKNYLFSLLFSTVIENVYTIFYYSAKSAYVVLLILISHIHKLLIAALRFALQSMDIISQYSQTQIRYPLKLGIKYRRNLH